MVLSACTSGVNIFGIAFQVDIGKEAGFAGGIVATAMSLKAIVNGTGRGVIGWLSDLYGRKQCLLFVCVMLGARPVRHPLVRPRPKNLPLFLIFSAISGFGGGAIFPMFAAMTADYFGENNNATNYGMVYSSKLVSGLRRGHGLRGRRRLGATTAPSSWPAASRSSPGVVALFLTPPGRAQDRGSGGIKPNPQPISREMD